MDASVLISPHHPPAQALSPPIHPSHFPSSLQASCFLPCPKQPTFGLQVLTICTQPYSKDVAGLQGRLVTVQQYVRISPGITSELATNIQSQLMSIGQELNAFFALLGNDHKKSQYLNGELRVQLDLTRKELAARKKQVEELQGKYITLIKERDTHRDKNAELVGRLGDTQAELMELRDFVRKLAAQDERNVAQLQVRRLVWDRSPSPHAHVHADFAYPVTRGRDGRSWSFEEQLYATRQGVSFGFRCHRHPAGLVEHEHELQRQRDGIGPQQEGKE